MLGLARLALRQSLPPGVLVALAAVLALALWSGGRDSVAFAGAGDPAGAAAALTRAGAWGAACCVIAPWAVTRAARLARIWARGDATWIGSRAVPRPAAAALALGGTIAAAALLVLATLGAVEVAVGPAGASRLRARTLPNPAVFLTDAAPSTSFRLPVAATSATLRLRPVVLPGAGPAADLAVRLRGGAGAAVERVVRVAGPASIEVPLPAPAGEVEVALERLGPGAVVALPAGSLELVLAAGRPARASLGIAARLLLGLAAGCSLAAGLGAWMRPALAGAAVLALWVLSWTGARPVPWLPAGDLVRAIGAAGEGFVLPGPGASAGLVALGCAALGHALLSLRYARGVAG